jgi:hypothetical protein
MEALAAVVFNNIEFSDWVAYLRFVNLFLSSLSYIRKTPISGPFPDGGVAKLLLKI